MPRRALGWGLVAYGLLGLTLLAVGLPLGLGAADRVERLAGSADGALRAAIRASEAAADGLVELDGSLAGGEESATSAAGLALDASRTLGSLGIAMELSVFGAQPLLPLAAEFGEMADESERLAGELTAIAGSLGASRSDLDTISGELRSLADELEEVRGLPADDPGGAPPLRVFLVLLVAWLALPAIGALAAGVAILRSTPRL